MSQDILFNLQADVEVSSVSCSGGCGKLLPKGRSSYCSACKVARNLYNTTKNNLKSGFNRKNKGSPELGITLQEFCVWRASRPMVCHYCSLAEDDLPKTGMKSQIQRCVQVMGVDRLDSTLGYVSTNLVPCCFVCNQIKGDRFSEEEMLLVGPGLREVWSRRLNTK